MFVKPFGSLMIVFGLIGCGGVGGNVQSYDELVEKFDDIDSKFNRGEVADITLPSSLPFSTQSTYRGVLGANLPDGSGDTISVVGDMTMTADFANSDIFGDVRNFVDSDLIRYSGILTIDNGEIDRAANVATTYTFAADIGGTLRNPENEATTVDGFLRGDFYNADRGFVSGNLVVDVTTLDGTISLDGANTYFVGER